MPSRTADFITAVRRFSHQAYFLDWVALAISIILLSLSFAVHPYKQQIMLSDPRIAHPHATHQRVSPSQLMVYSTLVPAATITLLLLALRRPWRTLHAALLGGGLVLVTADLLTNLVKNSVGRPRPDLLDRCQPRANLPTNEWLTVAHEALHDVCSQHNSLLLHDGWRSFPSGHSSTSFAGLAYLALVLAGQLHVFRPPRANFLTLLVVLVPLCLAGSIAISRLEDYRHDAYDVTAGSLLGAAVAYLGYRRYFPSLRVPNCHAVHRLESEVGGTQSKRQRDEELGDSPTNTNFHMVGQEDEDVVDDEAVGVTRGIVEHEQT